MQVQIEGMQEAIVMYYSANGPFIQFV